MELIWSLSELFYYTGERICRVYGGGAHMRHGPSIKDLSRQTGISRSTIYRVYEQVGCVSEDKLQRLAAAVGIDVLEGPLIRIEPCIVDYKFADRSLMGRFRFWKSQLYDLKLVVDTCKELVQYSYRNCKLDIKKLASISGISQRTLYDIVNDKSHDLWVSTTEKLLRICGLSWDGVVYYKVAPKRTK